MPGVSVFKVEGKMFALSRLDGEPLEVSLKCEPALAEQLRLSYPAIRPGYHLNKRHWNTVTLDGSLDDRMVRDMVEDSWDLVVDKLPAAMREPLRAAGAGGDASMSSDATAGGTPTPRWLTRRLYFVTEPLGEQLLAHALAGGVDIVQLRDKGATDDEVLAAAPLFRELCDRHGALFFVNDRPDLARAAGADGVHWARTTGPPEEVATTCWSGSRPTRPSSSTPAFAPPPTTSPPGRCTRRRRRPAGPPRGST